jgi:ABC-type uncharacterized transport system permease subunit
MNLVAFAVIAVVLYLLTSAALTVRLAGPASGLRMSRGTVLLLGLGAVTLHAWVLYPDLVTGQGLNLGFFNAASLIALLTATVMLLAAIKQPVENLGIPLQAVLLSIQEHHLRNRHPGGYIRALPPLQVMERLLFQMIGTGFALLSAALLTGFFFLEDIFAQHLVHKTALSMAAWVIFGVLLWGRWKFGWRGRTAIRWTLSGFIFLLLAYFGSKAVLELILARAT